MQWNLNSREIDYENETSRSGCQSVAGDHGQRLGHSVRREPQQRPGWRTTPNLKPTKSKTMKTKLPASIKSVIILAITGLFSGVQPTAKAWEPTILASNLQGPNSLWVQHNKVYLTETAGRNTSFGGNVCLDLYDPATQKLMVLYDHPINSDAVVVTLDNVVYLTSYYDCIPGESGGVSYLEPPYHNEVQFLNLEIASEDMCIDDEQNIFLVGSSDSGDANSLYKLPAGNYGSPNVLQTGLGRTWCIAKTGSDIYVGLNLGSYNGEIVWFQEGGPLDSFLDKDVMSMSFSSLYLYYADYFGGTVGRINLNTMDDETLLFGLNCPKSIRFDPTTGNLYFVEFGSGANQYKDGTLQVIYAIESVQPSLPNCAAAIATVVDGFVVAATVSAWGEGYTNTPSVRIIGGGGNGAQAAAVVSNGVVMAVHILDAGYGYTNTPVIIIAPPFIPQPTMGIAAMSLLSFTNLSVGTNYQLQSFLGNTWANVGAAFTSTSSTFTQYVSGTASANSYLLAATPVPELAYATAEMVDGFVVAATVTSNGFGYSASPAVTISGGGGSGAEAVAGVSNGVVIAVNVMDAGYGYTNTPLIAIAPPQMTALALWPLVTQTMKLDIGQLAPYDNYQLEFTPVMGGIWSSCGSPFTPTACTSTQYINVVGKTGYFRANYVP